MAEWHRVDPTDVPADGRVRSVTVDGRSVALSRCGARLGALENRCPHQGGPLGAGSTNLLTGLYDAKLDGAPVLAISGQVPSKVLGRGAFQDVDLSAVFRDVAVSTTTVHSGSDHGELAALAVKHAVDRRGVAHLVLPDEVQVQPSNAPAAQPAGRFSDRRIRPDHAALQHAAALVRDARRPV